ncbi:MAG: ABC transporter substrate-binding protein [Myxococcota bacterium]
MRKNTSIRTSWNSIALATLLVFATQSTFAQNVAAIDPAAETAAAAATPTAEAEASSPTAMIETFHAGLLEIMKEAKTLGFQGRVDRLVPLMGTAFDLEFMASKTVGRHWRKLSDEEKKKWSETFARFTTANYAGRFTGYTGEEFVTLGVEDAARGTRNVLTKIVVPDGEDVQLNYRVIERDGQWKVIDVYLNGTVSELALRRSEYSSALKREGFDSLMASIENKIEDLKEKGKTEG